MSTVVSPGTGERNLRRPKVCEGCGKRFVGAGAGPAPAGTVRHKARGRCSSCYERNRRGRTGPSGPPKHAAPCHGCGSAMCPRTRTAGPGERRYGGKGLCDLCYERDYRLAGRRVRERIGAPRQKPVPKSDPADARLTAQHAHDLARYIRARRARGWPDDGTLRGIVALRELEKA